MQPFSSPYQSICSLEYYLRLILISKTLGPNIQIFKLHCNKSLLFIMKYLALFLLATAILTLQPRQKAPSFEANAVLPDKSVAKISLNDYVGKYLVMVFYPFDFTYVCPTELTSYSDSVQKFKAINAEVVALSTDSQFSHLAWLNTPRKEGGVEGLKIPLISDINKQISKSYGVLVKNPTDELHGASLRGLFIIDGKGIIRSMTIHDAAVGRNVDQTIRIIEAFQYSDKNGVVCPANWKPGSNTIVPDQDKKKQFFKEL